MHGKQYAAKERFCQIESCVFVRKNGKNSRSRLATAATRWYIRPTQYDQQKGSIMYRPEDFDIIDMHTHPFTAPEMSIARFGNPRDMEEFIREMNKVGIYKFAGSVIRVCREIGRAHV